METRKWEFLLEAFLSTLIASLALQGNVGYQTSMVMIAAVHTLNLTRLVESYKKAQVKEESSYQETLD